jgi:hypothetical protein
MACPNPQLIREINIYALDGCGRIVTGSKSALTTLAFQNISWKDKITAATTTTKTNVAGKTCDTTTTCPIDEGLDLTFGTCGQNWALSALLGTGRLALSTAGDVVGFDRTDVSCTASVAVEVIFEPDVDACSGTSTTDTCLAVLFPNIHAWSKTSDATYDGKSKPDDTWTGIARKNGRLFANGLPTELGHWNAYTADIAKGDAFSITREVPCPDAKPEGSCELRQVA